MSLTRKTLTLDFALMARNGWLDPILTFSRASTATRFNPQTGLIELVGSDAPRLEKDGLLIEGAATNFLPQGANPSSSVGGNSYPVDFSSDVPVLMQGVPVARHQRKAAAGDNNLGVVYQQAEAGTYTVSCYIWLSAAIDAGIFFGYAGEAEATSVRFADKNRLNQWQRVEFTRTMNNNVFYVLCVGMSACTIYTTGWQFENGTASTSYIPTDGTPVTRAADRCTLKLEAPWWNPSDFTLIVDSMALYRGGSHPLFLTSAAFEASGRGDNNLSQYLGGNMSYADAGGGRIAEFPLPADGRTRLALRQTSQTFCGTQNGSAIKIVGTGSPIDLMPLRSLCLGAAWEYSVGSINGHIRSLQILPYSVPDLILQKLSSQ